MKNRLVIQSELKALDTVYQWLEIFFVDKISEKELRNILLITQEMVTNSILHGNQSIKEKQVILNRSINSTHVVIEIEDEGEGLKSLPSLEEAQELDYLAENGRGVKLAVLMTERIELKNNKMKLIFKINEN